MKQLRLWVIALTAAWTVAASGQSATQFEINLEVPFSGDELEQHLIVFQDDAPLSTQLNLSEVKSEARGNRHHVHGRITLDTLSNAPDVVIGIDIDGNNVIDANEPRIAPFTRAQPATLTQQGDGTALAYLETNCACRGSRKECSTLQKYSVEIIDKRSGKVLWGSESFEDVMHNSCSMMVVLGKKKPIPDVVFNSDVKNLALKITQRNYCEIIPIYTMLGGAGRPGPQGPMGPAGPAGLKGDKGDQGDRGDIGPRGLPGPAGEKGDAGAPGASGIKGDKGDKGDVGPRGLPGPAGEKGDAGTPGAPGLKGDKGDKGDIGATGLPGPAGQKGDTGPRGEKGEAGAKGERGDKGDKGDKGDTGAIGPMGPVGPAGAKGEPGNPGSKGDKGEAGPAGAKGDKGEAGAPGQQGPRGEKGDVGPMGTSGPVGPAGAKGEKGEKGDAGAKGDAGTKGDKGDRGEVGAQGAEGPRGPQGLPGAPGAPGAPGPKGDKGDKGDPGSSDILLAGDGDILIVDSPTIDAQLYTVSATNRRLEQKADAVHTHSLDELRTTVPNCKTSKGPICQDGRILRIGGVAYAPMAEQGNTVIQSDVRSNLKLGVVAGRWNDVATFDETGKKILGLTGSVKSADDVFIPVNVGTSFRVRVQNGKIQEFHESPADGNRELFVEIRFTN